MRKMIGIAAWVLAVGCGQPELTLEDVARMDELYLSPVPCNLPERGAKGK